MAQLAPFRGYLFDTAKVEASKFLAPPYDVILPADRSRLEALSPHNVVRLILPQGDEASRYQTAAQTFRDWEAAGVVKRDQRSALYRYHQVFSLPELGPRKVTRKGFVAGIKLHDYSDHVILPHERTLRGPKQDRLALMRATSASFDQVFGLYKDPGLEVDKEFADVERRRPDFEGTTADGTVHRVWRVFDREVISAVGRRMAPLPIYIADGHHRYETMLAYRDQARAAGAPTPFASTEFGSFFLANINDPDLVILATHRLVHSLPSFDRQSFLAKARELFSIETLVGGAKDVQKLKTAIADRDRSRPTVGAVFPGEPDALLLTVRVAPEDVGVKGHRSVVHLDVTILHALLLERVLGITREAQELQTNITYVKDTQQALDRAAAGEAQVAFILHPTQVDQVCAVADAFETMPQKSTFFHPKIASGVVMFPLSPDEDLEKAY